MPRLGLPSWLRRAIEAAVVAAIVALSPLIGSLLGSDRYAVPVGAAGALVLAPAILALGVLTISYPMAMAATRTDALLGAVGAYLIAVDLAIVFAGGRILLPRPGIEAAAGPLLGALALLPALAGLVAGQLATPLGFGRRAGALSAIVSAVVALGVLVVLAATV